MSLFLTGYTVVITVMFVLSAAAKVILKLLGKYENVPVAVQIEELIIVPFALVSLFGLVGYVMDKAVFNQAIWKLIFILNIVVGVASFWFPKMRFLRQKLSSRSFSIINGVGYLVSIPMLYILYLYAFGSFPTQPLF